MGGNQFNNLNDLANQEQKRHYANIVKIMAKARASQIRGKISDEEYNQIREKLEYGRLVNQGLEEYVENLLFYRYGLIDIYSKVIDIYGKYTTGFLPQKTFPSFEKEMEDFFDYIGCYELYKRIKVRSMIINDPNATLNVCINGGKTSYIVLKKPFISKQKPKESSIVHEMAHAYYYNVIADYKPTLYARDINSEIISLFFERLFLDFLEKNTNNPELIRAIIRNFETNLLAHTKESKKLLEVFDDPLSKYTITGAKLTYTKRGKETQTDLYGQTYAMGNIASAKLFNGYQIAPAETIRYLPELIKYISDTTFTETLLDCSDVEPLEECLEKRLVLKPSKKDA